MGIFEDVYSKAKVAADFAGKKTGEFVEISKLRINAADIQSKIDKEYQNLGLLVYSATKECKDCNEKVHEKAAVIDELYQQLGSVNDKIAELKKVKKCPECDYSNPEEANFCLRCGAKL